MKKLQSTFKTILLCTLTLLFFNCTKEKGVISNINFNYSTFTDSRDGKTYKSIKIGSQVWMAENLAYKTASGSSTYIDDANYGIEYGRLYTWDAAIQAVPNGWHLPTDEEWKQLEMLLGMSQKDADGIGGRGTNEGGKLKTTSGWAVNGNGTDEVGFLALPGGILMDNGGFTGLNYWGYWWSATDSINSTAWFRELLYGDSKIYRDLSFKGDGMSVRCVKD